MGGFGVVEEVRFGVGWRVLGLCRGVFGRIWVFLAAGARWVRASSYQIESDCVVAVWLLLSWAGVGWGARLGMRELLGFHLSR